MKLNDTRVEKRIVQKTFQLICMKGIKGWNMDQLAEEAGVAKNTLYKIIGSKEKLLQRVTIGIINDVQTSLSKILISDENYLTRLKKAVSMFPNLLNGHYMEHMHELFLEYPNIEICVQSHREDMTKNILHFIQQGIDTGVFHPALDAMHVFEMFQAMVLYYMKKDLSEKEKSACISKSIEYLIHGILCTEDHW